MNTTEVDGVLIVTDYVYPPIPSRQYDWVAYYDGDEGYPTGYGPTEALAIQDLTDNYPRGKTEERRNWNVMFHAFWVSYGVCLVAIVLATLKWLGHI